MNVTSARELTNSIAADDPLTASVRVETVASDATSL
jgi:hypothetical protein